jgi:hypothetical protein
MKKMMREAAAEALDSAEKLGGIKLREHVERIGRHYEHTPCPLQPNQVLKYVGIGKKNLLLLQKLGLVSTSPKNELESLLPKNLNTPFIRNVLSNLGIKTKAQAKQAVFSGAIRPNVFPKYGLKRHAEVCKWVGLPVTKLKTVTLRFITSESQVPPPDAFVLMAAECPPLTVSGYFDGKVWRLYSGEKFRYPVKYWSFCPASLKAKLIGEAK